MIRALVHYVASDGVACWIGYLLDERGIIEAQPPSVHVSEDAARWWCKAAALARGQLHVHVDTFAGEWLCPTHATPVRIVTNAPMLARCRECFRLGQHDLRLTDCVMQAAPCGVCGRHACICGDDFLDRAPPRAEFRREELREEHRKPNATE